MCLYREIKREVIQVAKFQLLRSETCQIMNKHFKTRG